MTTEEKTVQQHIEAVEAVTHLLGSTSKQIERMRRALAASRTTLEHLVDYQHPKVLMSAPSHLRTDSASSRDTYGPATVIKAQIDQINAILGDRA